MLRCDRSSLEPFERARAEIEFVSGLLVGGAAQALRVIDAILRTGLRPVTRAQRRPH
jgi:hypothetical protein